MIRKISRHYVDGLAVEFQRLNAALAHEHSPLIGVHRNIARNDTFFVLYS